MTTINDFCDENDISLKQLVGDVFGLINEKIAIDSRMVGGHSQEKKWKNYKKIIKSVFDYADFDGINV